MGAGTHISAARRLWVLLCQWEVDSKHNVSLFFCSFFPGVSYKSTYYFIRPSKERSRYCYTAESEGSRWILFYFVSGYWFPWAYRPLISEACAAPQLTAVKAISNLFVCDSKQANQLSNMNIFFIAKWNHIPKWPRIERAPLSALRPKSTNMEDVMRLCFWTQRAINLRPFVIRLRTPDGAKSEADNFVTNLSFVTTQQHSGKEKCASSHLQTPDAIAELDSKRSFETGWKLKALYICFVCRAPALPT